MKFQLERILLFSDAVFAIAITLMVIEAHPPHLEHGLTFTESLHSFTEVIPMIVGTILSFGLIGLFWHRHHNLMQHLVAYDNHFIKINMALLLSIAFIPFSTAFVFHNEPSSLPFLIYNLNYIVTTLINLRLYNYALNPKNKLVTKEYTEELKSVRKNAWFSVTIFIIVIIVAFIKAQWAPVMYTLFAFSSLVDRKK